MAGLIGFALGDAYGHALQGKAQPFRSELAEVSDATQTMLATCEALIRGQVRFHVGGKQPSLPDMVWRSLCIWGANQDGMRIPEAVAPVGLVPAWLSEQPVMRRQNRHGHALDKAFLAGPDKTLSAGCGVLSRIVAMPLAGSWVETFIPTIAALTHNDPAATAASVALYRIGIAMVEQDQTLVDAVRVALPEAAQIMANQSVPATMREGFVQALRPGSKLPPSQLAPGALARAVRAAVTAKTFPEVLEQAGNGLAHDRATICALAGYLWSLQAAREPIPEPEWQHPSPLPSGVQYFPSAWLERLEGRAAIERIAADVERAFTNPVRLDVDIQARFPGY